MDEQERAAWEQELAGLSEFDREQRQFEQLMQTLGEMFSDAILSREDDGDQVGRTAMCGVRAMAAMLLLDYAKERGLDLALMSENEKRRQGESDS